MHYCLKLTTPVHIGITQAEQSTPQPLEFSVTFDFEATTASQTDDIADTVDYQVIYDTIKTVTQTHRWNLVESLHAQLLSALKTACLSAENLTLAIKKSPWPDGTITLS